MTARKPAVSGIFYPSDPEELSRTLRGCYLGPVGPGALLPAVPTKAAAVACVAPHAALQYSGAVAAHSYLHVSSLRAPELIVIVGPNHNGIGAGVSTVSEGEWETPAGRAAIDSDAAASLIRASDVVEDDPRAHAAEHSIEVQLPFLQQIYGAGFRFLPVSLLDQDLSTASSVGKSLAAVAKGRRSVLVASSDLTHYQRYDDAVAKDTSLLERIAAMDVEGFYEELDAAGGTVCGFGPVAAVMVAARLLGLSKGELLKYANSGDTGGDKGRVVGYGSARFV